jgi:hypothetical protein
VLLLMAFVLLWVLMAPIAWLLRGGAGVIAAGLATLVCLLSAWVALLVTSLLAPPGKPAAYVGVGMAFRMGVPLGVCLLVLQRYDELVKAGFAWYLIAAFMVGLLLETLMAVGELKSSSD